MKITRGHWDRSKPRIEVSIADAIEASAGHTNRDGEIERLREQIDNQAKMIGVLVEALANSGKLSRDDVSNMLSYQYTIEE